MNKNQFTAIFYTLFAILNVLTAILAFLGKKDNIQQYIDSYEEFAREACSFFRIEK